MTSGGRPAPPRLTYQSRLFLLALLAGVPGTAVAWALLWAGGYSPKVRWTFALLVLAIAGGAAGAVRRRVVFPLQTLSNLLAALREGDFSIRARGARRGDVLGEVYLEANALSETLREERLGSMEASALLRKVMAEIDAAIFAFDDDEVLRLVNRAGERLLAQPSERLLGRRAADLGLEPHLEPGAPALLAAAFPGGAGRWEVRRGEFRQAGMPLRMLVLIDLSRALREEERLAWQRLIRVLGHEMNNSLAPIRSIAGSLETLLARRPRPEDWEVDMRRGLAVIAARSDALGRFMDGYARLARLPRPQLRRVDVGALIRRVAGLEMRVAVEVAPGPEVSVSADADQLEQLLINLVRNGADAALETGGRVRVGWRRNRGHLELLVEDDGPGLSSTANLFVPFFTTKPGGSGIGLVLSRQIAEAHGGTLSVGNRSDASGCEARLRLPLAARIADGV